ncbi:hypothetical protein FG386_003705 [Cryptosporidium ryanae]|uniref:uncharacterized protein n=1 Tax=Cryptosporidium ryanae TaxID=515981 RepID=UPI00351A16CE|nr:hypothetical protein FG386_003705 [Cryptosporidium ryanae]
MRNARRSRGLEADINKSSSAGKNAASRRDKNTGVGVGDASGLKTAVSRKGDVLVIKEGDSVGRGVEVVKRVPLFDMKPYMRTPKNLIHNYTQKERRPKPKYNTLPCERDRYRYSVVLDDPKGREEDRMVFETNESFENMELAQNYAALLALKHLQGSRPLYKLLPSPMDVAWKSLDTSNPLVTRRNKHITKKERALEEDARLKKKLEGKNKLEMSEYKEKMEIPTLSMSLNTRTRAISIIRKHIPVLSKSYSFSSWLFDGFSEFVGIPDSVVSAPKLVSFRLASEVARGKTSDRVNALLDKRSLGVGENTKYISLRLEYWFGVDVGDREKIVRLIEKSGFKSDKAKAALDLLLKELDLKSRSTRPAPFNGELGSLLFGKKGNGGAGESKVYVDYSDVCNLCIVTEVSVSCFPIHYIAWVCVMWLSLHVNEDELPALLSPKRTQIEVKGFRGTEGAGGSGPNGGGGDRELRFEKSSGENGLMGELLSKQLDSLEFGADSLGRARRRAKSGGRDLIRVKRNGNLSASRSAEDIVNKLKGSQVLVVKGETGCGKTTQIPILLYEGITQHDESGSSMIYCTEPRRLAAISVSRRVSAELRSAEVSVSGDARRRTVGGDSAVSDLVGYSVRLDRKVTENTRLIYCTHGILTNIIRSELTAPEKSGSSDESRIPLNSILILDEAHERSLDVDLLLYFMKQIAFSRKDIKLVIMSASIEVAEFVDYFNRSNRAGAGPAISTISLPGRTPFPIQVEYLPFTSKYFSNKAADSESEPDGFGDSSFCGCVGGPYGDIRICKPLDISRLRDHVVSIIRSLGRDEGSVLVFLGGISDVNNLVRLLNEEDDAGLGEGESRTLPIHALPCHSNLSYSQQMEIFKPMSDRRKVIVSTNIAEVSLTIEDIRYVIDTGRVRISMYDPVKHMTSLQEVFVSRSSAQQRMGRAGRTCPGKCFRLYREEDLAGQPLELTPEILRLPVEHIILDILCFIDSNREKHRVCGGSAAGGPNLQRPDGLKDSFEVIRLVDSLTDFFTPPKLYSIEASLQLLRSYGALDDLLCITPLGRLLSKWPVDTNIGMLFLYGLMFDCIKPLIVVASFLTCDLPWKFETRGFGDGAQSPGVNCDYMTFIKVYNYYVLNCKDKTPQLRANAADTGERKLPFDPKFLDPCKMETVYQTAKHFARMLNIRDAEGPDYLDENALFSRWNIIRNCIAVSLYPNVSCIRLPKRIKYIDKGSGRFAESIRFNKLFLYIKNKTSAKKRVFNHHFVSILNEDPLSKREAYNIVLESDETNRVYLSESSAVFNRMYDVGTFHCVMYLSLFRSFNSKNTFLRFPIPTSMYSLLLFSSNTLEINPTSILRKMRLGGGDTPDCSTNYILIDDWILLQCPGLIQSIVWYFRFVIQDLTQYVSSRLTRSFGDGTSAATRLNARENVKAFDFGDFNRIVELLNLLI